MGDVDAVQKMLAPDFVNHTNVLPDEEPGREGFMRAVAQYNAAFSNSSVLIEDQVAAGDKVVSRCVVRRTHDRGKVMGVAPSGRELTYLPVVIHRVEGGKIAEQWGGGTGLSELRGLGLEQAERERERIEQELLVAKRIQWNCVGSVDCFRLRTVRGKESIATNKAGIPTGVSSRSYPAGQS